MYIAAESWLKPCLYFYYSWKYMKMVGGKLGQFFFGLPKPILNWKKTEAFLKDFSNFLEITKCKIAHFDEDIKDSTSMCYDSFTR